MIDLAPYCRALAKECRGLLLLVLTVMCAVGCKSDDSVLVGDWRGEFRRGTQAIRGADLHLGKDHRFRLVYLDYDMEGSWRKSGYIVTLTPETIGGKTMDEVERRLEERGTPEQQALKENFSKPIDVTLSGDGKTLTTDTVAGGRTIYTKED